MQLQRLALETLGSFQFGPQSLLPFVKEHILIYLDHNEYTIRKAAALAACQVLHRHVALHTALAQDKGGHRVLLVRGIDLPEVQIMQAVFVWPEQQIPAESQDLGRGDYGAWRLWLAGC